MQFKTSAPSDRAERATSLLGRYRILEQLSVSPHFTVHRACAVDQHNPQQFVAIKRLRARRDLHAMRLDHDAVRLDHDAARLDHDAARQRLLREAHVGLALHAANVVRVLEVHVEPELFVVMEHLEGLSLRALLTYACPVKVALRVCIDALSGLSALHHSENERGLDFVVHRAPSARHMHVDTDGITRLIDLSHAHGSLLGGLPDDPTLRGNELAPEQVSAPAGVDPRCDLFIVGLVLWEVLTGEPLLDARERDAHKRFARIFPLRNLADSGAQQAFAVFDSICRRALAAERRDRFTSASQMARALEQTAQAAGLLAERASVAGWVRKALSLQGSAESAEHALPHQPRGIPPPPSSLLELAGTKKLSFVAEAEAEVQRRLALARATHDANASSGEHAYGVDDTTGLGHLFALRSSEGARGSAFARATEAAPLRSAHAHGAAPLLHKLAKPALAIAALFAIVVLVARMQDSRSEPTHALASDAPVLPAPPALAPRRELAPTVTQLAAQPSTQKSPLDVSGASAAKLRAPAAARTPAAVRASPGVTANKRRRGDGQFEPEVLFYEPKAKSKNKDELPDNPY